MNRQYKHDHWLTRELLIIIFYQKLEALKMMAHVFDVLNKTSVERSLGFTADALM